jgi:hypothetical protein
MGRDVCALKKLEALQCGVLKELKTKKLEEIKCLI